MMLLLSAAAGPLAAEELSKAPKPRSESLELPGLTAGCHICEWRPKLNQMPAGDDFGGDGVGAPTIGLVEGGYSPDCQREVHFLRCGTSKE